MSKRLIITGFLIGAVALAVLTWLTWARPSEWVIERIVVTGRGNEVINVTGDREIFPLIIFLINGAAILFLLVLGFIYNDTNRWLAFTFAAILLTGLSLNWIYSLGGFLLPFGVLLLINSLLKLRQYRNPEVQTGDASK